MSLVEPVLIAFQTSSKEFLDTNNLLFHNIYFVYDGLLVIHIKYYQNDNWQLCALKRTGGTTEVRSKVTRCLMPRCLNIQLSNQIIQMVDNTTYAANRDTGRFLWNFLVKEGFTKI
jgi:hypothetical protein